MVHIPQHYSDIKKITAIMSYKCRGARYLQTRRKRRSLRERKLTNWNLLDWRLRDWQRYQTARNLTFSSQRGVVRHLKIQKSLNSIRFLKTSASIVLDNYQMII